MKDRIKQLMESQHMTQQVFADFIGIAPATLSGIFSERTRPTINTVEAIKKKLPSLNTEWLIFGKEPMYIDQSTASDDAPAAVRPTADSPSTVTEPMLDFGQSQAPTPQMAVRPATNISGVRNTRLEMAFENMNNIDKQPRRVTEIRVFYDDQTWESFVPAKK